MIVWGRRLLYLTLFLVLMIIFNLWTYPITFAYLGAILALILTALFVIDDKWEEE